MRRTSWEGRRVPAGFNLENVNGFREQIVESGQRASVVIKCFRNAQIPRYRYDDVWHGNMGDWKTMGHGTIVDVFNCNSLRGRSLVRYYRILKTTENHLTVVLDIRKCTAKIPVQPTLTQFARKSEQKIYNCTRNVDKRLNRRVK